MDTGPLIFIIAIEALIIVWLASKLRQYEKFEQLLGSETRNRSSTSSRTGSSAASGSTSSDQSAAESSDTPSASSASSVAAASDEDLLDMPEVEPEENIEEAKRVQLVMARCRYAEFYLEQLDDDYERGQFKHIINSCMTTARGISDPFFRDSALHPIVLLLDRADWSDQRDQLMNEIKDDLVRQRVQSDLSEQAES